jgi:hypothetical protein
MFGLTRGAVGLAALIAAGVVSVDNLSEERRLTSAAPVAARLASEVPVPLGQGVDLAGARRDAAAALDALTAAKTERSDAARCSDQTWPQIERTCLVPVDGAELRQRVRVVTPERRSTPDPVISRPARTELASR